MRLPLPVRCTAWVLAFTASSILVAPSEAAAFTPAGAVTRPAHRHRTPRVRLTLRAPLHGRSTLPPLASEAVRPQLDLPPNYLQERTDRVKHDLMIFDIVEPGQNPVLPSVAPPPDHVISSTFVKPSDADDPLSDLRETDRLLLFRTENPNRDSAAALGLGMFLTAVVVSAHAPQPLRALFDGPVHLGPVLFPNGGMGAGVGGRIF